MTQRVAFKLRLKPGAGPTYDAAHRAVWPELLALLKAAVVSEYSIFRRDEELLLVMRVEHDFATTWSQIEHDPVNLRWQQTMQRYFAPMDETVAGTNADERFPMFSEVFYLP